MRRELQAITVGMLAAVGALLPAVAAAQQSSEWLKAGPLRPPETARAAPLVVTPPAPLREVAANSQPVGLTRKLLNKAVVVHQRDGSVSQGRLVTWTQESLLLRVPDGRDEQGKMRQRIESSALTEVGSVGQPINPKLLEKKVVVYLHDGQRQKGRLRELTADALLLDMSDGSQQIARADVARVRRQPMKWWKPFAVAGEVTLFAVLLAVTAWAGLDPEYPYCY